MQYILQALNDSKLRLIVITVDVKCLYMAPEILERTETSAIGTKGGDVYSFGIIMNDLTLMAGPYSIEMTDLTTEGRCVSGWIAR